MIQSVYTFGKSRADRYDLCILAGMFVYILFLSLLSLYRYTNFFSDIDLAIFNNSFWTTIHQGGILENTLEFNDKTHLGIHFSPILLSLLPAYLLFPSPETLIISQTILLAAGAIPIYLLGKEKLGPEAGCGLGILYLLYPALHGVNLYDFHEVCFLPFLLGMAFWGFLTGRDNYALLFSLLCLLVKEDTFPVICMIGLCGLWVRGRPLRERWQYIVLTILPLLLFFGYFFLIKAAIYGGISDGSSALSQYGDLLGNLAANNDLRLLYLAFLLLPLLFLPLLSPEVLIISLPSFLEILLSPNTFYFNINSHYSALLIPVIFAATIVSLEKITRREGCRFLSVPHLVVLLLLVSVVISALYSPASYEFRYMEGGHGDVEEHALLINSIIGKISPDATVSTQDNLASQLSSRAKIWHDYRYHQDADIIIYDTAYPQSAALSGEKAEIEKTHNLAKKVNGISLYVRKVT